MAAASGLPYLPFTRPSIDEDTIADVAAVLRSGSLTGGPKVREFENALSAYCGGRQVRTFHSGTAALTMALRLLNIGPGDEVITTPLTWVATSNVILAAGARPVFVDVTPDEGNLDLIAAERAVTRLTKAIMPVDLAGHPVDRRKLAQLAETSGVRIIEDAAQSLGANWDGHRIGGAGDFVALSFQANKSITTGEGGALVLPDDADIDLCERLRAHGVRREPDGTMDVDVLGTKANMTDIAAAIGLRQLSHLDEVTQHRRKLAQHYFSCLPSIDGLQMPPADFTQANWHMFRILLPEGVLRHTFMAEMKEKNIAIGVHYPAIHLFTLYKQRGHKNGQFPVAESIGRRTVTLPLFNSMTLNDVERVCHAVQQILR